MVSSVLLLVLQLLLATVLVSSQKPKDCDCSAVARGPIRKMSVQKTRQLYQVEHPHTSHAVCHMQSNNESSISGNVYFRRQRGDGIEILMDLRGFPTNEQAHGIHVHEFGDLTEGCETLGGHYNPHNRRHGSHEGDLGNFRPNSSGVLRQTVPHVHLQLHGAHSIIGRSIVVHADEDDLGHLDEPGSSQHGNAGHRLACCVIGVSSGRGWPQE